MADLDRVYISQYQAEILGLIVSVAGVPTNADALVQVTVTNQDTQATLFTRTAVHTATGQYQLQLTPDDTAVLGNYIALWAYQLSGVQRTFSAFFGIGGAEPAYDNLADGLKTVVDNVWIRFADLFDSPSGGPHLQTYFQANWNRGRVAQLMGFAVGYLNTMAQPYSTYTAANFPITQWGSLLEQATYIECLKHLRRSYVEQPDYQGSSISRLDRRDYMLRWEAVLADEQEMLKQQMDVYKISQMMLGRPAVLVSGGVYGRGIATTNMPGTAGRPRFYYQRY